MWLFLLTLPGGKFTRYVITLLPAVLLLQALGIYMLYSMAAAHMRKREGPRIISGLALAGLLAVSAGWQIVLLARYHPHYSLYVAQHAGGERRHGYYFPQDDFYDAGLREAIGWIAGKAPANAEVIGSTPSAFRYYQRVFGRPDLKFESTFDRKYVPDPARMPFVIHQEYRTYLENRHLMTFFYGTLKPLHAQDVLGCRSVTVYRLCPGEECARTPFWESRHWTGRLRLMQAPKP
jgi:hypothetical protein